MEYKEQAFSFTRDCAARLQVTRPANRPALAVSGCAHTPLISRPVPIGGQARQGAGAGRKHLELALQGAGKEQTNSIPEFALQGRSHFLRDHHDDVKEHAGNGQLPAKSGLDGDPDVVRRCRKAGGIN